MAELPRAVTRFLSEHINSVEQLEILLLLRTGDRAWTAGEIARELSTSPSSAEVRLEDLARAQLVVRDGDAYRCRVREDLRPVLEQVAESYAKLRVRVISQIFAQPSEGVRSFSDAFRLREDE